MNKWMSRIAVTGVLGLSGVLMSNAVMAQPAAGKAGKAGKGQGQRGGRGPLQKILAQLDLSADQKAKTKAIMEEQAPKQKALRDDNTLDRKAKGAKMKELRDETNAKVRVILTADQATKFDQLMAEAKADRANKAK